MTRARLLVVTASCVAGIVLWHSPAKATFLDMVHDACVAAMTDADANALVDPTIFIDNCVSDVVLTGVIAFVAGDAALYFNHVQVVASTCPAAPLTGCRSAGTSTFAIGRNDKPSKNKLAWKWRKGQTLDASDLGDPLTDTNYLLCVYADDALLFQTTARAGSEWTAAAGAPPKAFTYKDKLGTNDGIKVASVHAGADGKAKAGVKGSGDALPAADLPLTATSVTVELVGSHLPRQCLIAEYTVATAKNTDKTFLAKLP